MVKKKAIREVNRKHYNKTFGKTLSPKQFKSHMKPRARKARIKKAFRWSQTVASNYMTEADTESIWATGDLDATRFGKIGVRMAEFINFKLYRDATNQCATAAVLPLLEEFSEEVLIDLIASAKISATTNPWDFIQARVSDFLIRKYRIWKEEFEEIRSMLGTKKSIEIVTRTL